ncbi:hypothetical protein MNBD_GAMMA05-686 [hydrothermal vent metagenome]|uniref:Flagellar biosynthesis protein FliL n=1 Tax=hydrothermal vent metagenome TaxID=652676 RepID=A0A3B0WIN5_9ZZZZ
MADEEAKEEETAPAKSGNMKIIIIAVLAAVLLSSGLVGGTLYFVMGDEAEASTEEVAEGEEEEEEEVIPLEPPMYHSMDPKFVVSFRDQRSARFMQFSIEVMARNKDIIKQVVEHSPAVRSNLLMLFDTQSYEIMSTREGKQKLLDEVIVDINTTLKKVTGEEELVAVFEAAYFTSFVIQ